MSHLLLLLRVRLEVSVDNGEAALHAVHGEEGEEGEILLVYDHGVVYLHPVNLVTAGSIGADINFEDWRL